MFVQIFKRPSNQMLAEAGRYAGATRVELVYEAEAATAFFAHEANEWRNWGISPGDTVITADLGGGTADFATFRFTSDTSMGAQSKLEQVGNAEGMSQRW